MKGWIGLFTLLCWTVTAQTPTASLTGSVKDPSGAAVAGAEITVINVDTGAKRVAKSNELGFYTVPLLPPGRYDAIVRLAGFRTLERKGLSLHVNETVTVDFTLELGPLTETITVQAEASPLQTSGGSHGAVIVNTEITNLPLNARNPFALAALAPGVQPQGGFFVPRVFQEQAYQSNFTANGGASFQNDILLDGASNTVAGHGQLAFTPLVDAIEEFKVQTSNYSAEYGRSGGAIINIVTKSGTNELKGTAYEFMRNKVLDANNFFNNRAGIPRQPFVFNQFGITLGGPVVVPRVYQGRNRTFFFVGYEGSRARRRVYFSETVPTEAMRRGDFSGLRTPTGQPIVVYNPFSTRSSGTGYTRDPFPGNQIPPAMHDKVGANVTKYYPLPNQATGGLANNFIANASQPNDLNTVQARVDHNLSSANRFFFRVSYDKLVDVSPNPYGNIAGEARTFSGSSQPDWHVTLGDTHSFGPATLLDLRAGFARNGFRRQPGSYGFDPTQLGFPPALARDAQALQFPQFAPSGYATLGALPGHLFYLGADTYSAPGQLMLIRGRHTLKLGGDFRVYRHNSFQASAPVGNFSFSKGFTQGPDPLRSTLTAGDAFASMLLGAASGGSASIRAHLSFQTVYWAAYLQDDVRVTDRLTLNLGIRYDYETPRTERFNRLSFFDYDAPNPVGPEVGLPNLRGGLKFVGVGGNPRGWTDPDRNNIGPRFGFAYKVTNKLVVRGGYGLLYLPGGTNNLSYSGCPQEGFSASTPLVTSIDGGLTPFTLLANAFAGGLQRPTGSSLGLRTQLGQGVNGNPRYLRVGYMQQWNLALQHELPGRMIVEAGYAGSRGVKLPFTYQVNQLPDRYLAEGPRLLTMVRNPFASVVTVGTLSQPTVTLGQLLRPYPHFTGVSFPQGSAGASTYHALQVRVERRISRSFSVLAAYTNSKLISDTHSQKTWISDEYGAGPQNNNNLRLERSLAPQDVSQRFVVNYIYELPLGKGRRWLNRIGPAADAIVGGWTLTGITTFQTGRPLALSTATNNTNSYGGGSRPNNNGTSARLPASQRSLQRWFDTTVFSQPEPFTFGSTGRTLPDVREDGVTNFDVSVHKNFHLNERFTLQFRGEFFNLMNSPQFARPGQVFGNPQFAVVSAQANSPRQIQLGAKLLY